MVRKGSTPSQETGVLQLVLSLTRTHRVKWDLRQAFGMHGEVACDDACSEDLREDAVDIHNTVVEDVNDEGNEV